MVWPYWDVCEGRRASRHRMHAHLHSNGFDIWFDFTFLLPSNIEKCFVAAKPFKSTHTNTERPKFGFKSRSFIEISVLFSFEYIKIWNRKKSSSVYLYGGIYVTPIKIQNECTNEIWIEIRLMAFFRFNNRKSFYTLE